MRKFRLKMGFGPVLPASSAQANFINFCAASLAAEWRFIIYAKSVRRLVAPEEGEREGP